MPGLKRRHSGRQQRRRVGYGELDRMRQFIVIQQRRCIIRRERLTQIAFEYKQVLGFRRLCRHCDCLLLLLCVVVGGEFIGRDVSY